MRPRDMIREVWLVEGGRTGSLWIPSNMDRDAAERDAARLNADNKTTTFHAMRYRRAPVAKKKRSK